MIIKVIDVPLPPTSIVGQTTDICMYAPYIYSVQNPLPNVNYVWTVINGTILGPSTGASITVSFDNHSLYEVQVVAQANTKPFCTSESINLIVGAKVINANIVNVNSTARATVCGSSTESYKLVLPLTTTSYTAGATYDWSIVPPSAGSIVSGQASNNIQILWNNTFLAAGQPATIKVEIKECTVKSIKSLGVTINPKVQLAIAAPAAVCSGSQVQFTVSSTTIALIAGSGGSSVNWDFGDGTTYNSPVGIYTATHTFTNLGSGSIGIVVTATIINPNGCLGTATVATPSITINPGPKATLSIAIGSQGNSFCTVSEISTIFSAATPLLSTVNWYFSNNYYGTAANSTFLAAGVGTINAANYVAQTGGFGYYFFTATGTNTCTTRSNVIQISKSCTVAPNCIQHSNTVSLNVTNNCGILTIAGTHTGTTTDVYYDIFGPSQSILYHPATDPFFYPALPGAYHIFYNCKYATANNQLCPKRADKTIVVPYTADFAYKATCTNNNAFDIEFFDKNTFYTGVTNQTIQYSYQVNGAGPFINCPANFNTLPAGNYVFQVTISGDYPNIVTLPCSKTIAVTLATIPTQQIIFIQPKCHNTPVQFAVSNPVAGDTYLWNFITNNVTNSLAAPIRNFENNLTVPLYYNVQVDITNASGCTRTLKVRDNSPQLSDVIVPAKCFKGTVEATPSETACDFTDIELSYNGTADQCVPSNSINGFAYSWMNGLVDMDYHYPTLTVNSWDPAGFYWLKVKSANGCEYSTTNIVAPKFIATPSIYITGDSNFCEGDAIKFHVNTLASSWFWTLDGVTIITNVADVTISNFTPNSGNAGQHTIAVTTTDPSGCNYTQDKLFFVSTAPTVAVVAVANCAAHSYSIIATGNEYGNYNWSNGMSGTGNSNTITVNNGGPYKVTFTNQGGCSTSYQITIPKFPDVFLWEIPTGCYNFCKRVYNATILGPNLPLKKWQWLQNGNVAIAGGISTVPATPFVPPLVVSQTGTYNLNINTGDCEQQSPPLKITLAECTKCDGIFDNIIIKNITPKYDLFCTYSVTIGINNPLPTPITYNLSYNTNLMIIGASSYTLSPGGNTITLTCVPINGFAYGNFVIMFSTVNATGEKCFGDVKILFPFCNGEGKAKGAGLKVADSKNSFELAPNPAIDIVKINYSS